MSWRGFIDGYDPPPPGARQLVLLVEWVARKVRGR